jgi:gliding motility-associated-like protein
MKYQNLLLLGLLFIISQASLKAAHIIGGELTYVCNGPLPSNPNLNSYTFTMTVYRDCAGGGAAFDSAPGAFATGTVSIYRGAETTEFMNVILDAPVITNIESSVESNPCVIVPPGICGEKGVYTFFANLETIDSSYHVVYQRCCRNNTITNIIDPGAAGSTYYVEVTPLAQQTCNSSPVFTNLPETVICVNEPLNIDASAFDVEGDQLVYSFCSPLSGGTQTNVAPNPDDPPASFTDIAFLLPNYSALEPLGGNPVVTIDPFTGVITGTATEQGRFVVGICVQEYRNGELLSTIQRDYQFNVAYCEQAVNAELQGMINSDGIFVFQSCVDSTLTFLNESTGGNSVEDFLWTFDIPGDQPLSFTSQDVTVTFPGPGFYTGIMEVNPGTLCSDTAILNITISDPILPEFSFNYDTCVAGPVSFTNLTPGVEEEDYEWTWQFGDGNFSDEENPEHLYEEPGMIPVLLTVTDTFGCTESVSNQVNWFPAPPIIVVEPSTFVGCPPAEVEFVNLSSPIDSTYDIVWNFGDGRIGDDISPTHVYERPGTFDVGIQITSPIGCFIERKFDNWIFIDSLPIADFNFAPEKRSNFEPEVNFTDQSTRAVFWEWRFDQFGGTIEKDPLYEFPDTGMMEVQLVVTHIYGCQDSITQIIDIEPQVTYWLPNAFTPNGDGKNEGYRGGGFFRGIQDFNMQIFNRSGGRVFQSADPAEAWNGQQNNTGRMSPNGVYLVQVRFRGPRGKMQEYKGFATLMR